MGSVKDSSGSGLTLRWVCCCLLLVGLTLTSGCVTSTDSRFARGADQEEAVNDYVKLATAYLSQGNYDRARKHLERALNLDSNSSQALAMQGLLYQTEGEAELAEQSYRQAISSDSSNTRGRVFYGAFLFGEQRYEAARDQFALASRDTGYEDRASIFYNLGRSEEQLGNIDSAVDAYRRALELGRGDPRWLLALSRVLTETGNFSAASRYYSQLVNMIQRAPKLRHSPESLWVGIRIARHFRDYDQESSLALLLRNQYPDSDEYRQYRAVIADDNG